MMQTITLEEIHLKLVDNVMMLLTAEGQSVALVYVDEQGWVNVVTDTTISGSSFVTATGGTITTDGDFKIHTFNADRCFAVTQGIVPNKVGYATVCRWRGGGYSQGGGSEPEVLEKVNVHQIRIPIVL